MDRLKVTSLAYEACTGETLEAYLAGARREGKTLEQIAREVYFDTDGKIEVAHTTISRWLGKIEGADRG